MANAFAFADTLVRSLDHRIDIELFSLRQAQKSQGQKAVAKSKGKIVNHMRLLSGLAAPIVARFRPTQLTAR